MNGIARTLLTGAYVTVLIYLAWPLFEDPQQYLINLAPSAVVLFLITVAVIRAHRALYLLGALLNAVIFLGVSIGATAHVLGVDTSTQLASEDWPALLFFLWFVPGVAAYGFLNLFRGAKSCSPAA